jgi:predicted nucleic acid-binding protein
VLVVDASAVLEAIVALDPMPDLIERLAQDGDLHAPHLLDIEVLHALRRLNALGQLSDERASDALADFQDLALVRYPHVGLADRIWELRHNLTAYDAAYVALAETLDVALVTCDVHLREAPGHVARVELFATGQAGADG